MLSRHFTRSGLCWTGPLLILLLQGCAGTPQTRQLLAHPPAQLPAVHELVEVPFHPQEAYQCGPAALATLLNWQDIPVTPQQLTPRLYIPGKQGSLQIELLSNTRQQGLIPYVLRPQLDDLLSEVAAGNPVLVFQNLALDWYPRWHYAVVVGYDLGEARVFLRSGLDERRVNSLALFERTWQRAERWAMLTLQPGQLPATVEYWRYLQAVADMEKVGRFREALAGYQAGLGHWPDDPRLAMGLGNSHYALGEPAQAGQIWLRLTEQQPDYGPAFNNLAQLRLQQGRLGEAKALARHAVDLGGPHQTAYEQTLQQILAAERL